MAKHKSNKKGPQQKETPFKGQYTSTSIINRLASDLNSIIQLHIGDFKRTSFYRRLQKTFRQVQSGNRFVLLSQLKEMEINPDYPSKKYLHALRVANGRGKIVVNLDVVMHVSRPKKVKCNCYCYKVVLLTWDKSDNLPKHEPLFSDWIDMDGGKPGFEFEFQKPEGTTNWLLCIRQMLGLDQKRLGTFASESMYIAEVGTFDKKEQALLEKAIEEKNRRPSPRTESHDVDRVKPKRMN